MLTETKNHHITLSIIVMLLIANIQCGANETKCVNSIIFVLSCM